MDATRSEYRSDRSLTSRHGRFVRTIRAMDFGASRSDGERHPSEDQPTRTVDTDQGV
jgi:hypothetical protein